MLVKRNEPDKRKTKKYRVVVLLWEIEPTLIFKDGAVITKYSYAKVHKRFDKDFDTFLRAQSAFILLRDKLEEIWKRVTLRR